MRGHWIETKAVKSETGATLIRAAAGMIYATLSSVDRTSIFSIANPFVCLSSRLKPCALSQKHPETAVLIMYTFDLHCRHARRSSVFFAEARIDADTVVPVPVYGAKSPLRNTCTPSGSHRSDSRHFHISGWKHVHQKCHNCSLWFVDTKHTPEFIN